MSLGWQTESALVPRQGKAIEVDGKSLVALKALVYAREQQLHQQQQPKNGYRNTDGSSSSSSGSSGARSSSSRKKRRRTDDDDDGKRAGTAAQTEKANGEDADDIVLKSLKAKAEVYDLIRSTGDNSASGSSGTINVSKADKELIAKYTQSASSTSSINFRTTCGIIDARSSSSAQKEPVRSDKESAHEAGSASSSAPGTQWAWSRGASSESGQRGEEFQANYEARMALQALIESKKAKFESGSSSSGGVNDVEGVPATTDQSEPRKTESSTSSNPSSSNAGRVKSQWEKTLTGSARAYLDEVHSETIAERGKNLAQAGPTSSIIITNRASVPSLGTAEAENVVDVDVVVTAPKTTKELRREMIRKQQMEKGML
jgi:hypothetical protein